MAPCAPAVHLTPCGHSRPFSSFATSRPTRTACRATQPGVHKYSGAWWESLRGLSWADLSFLTLQKIGARVCAAGLAAAIIFGPDGLPASAVTNEQLLFLEAWRAVDRAYYDKNFNGKPWFKIREQFLKERSLNDRQETYAAIRALLAQLDDPFTRFLEPSRYAALKRGTAGSLTGVGLEVEFDVDAGTDSPLVVITPSPGGPADKAGIQPRDAVLAIDGKPTAGTSLYDAGELLQGPDGSQVTLRIRAHEGGEERDVQLSRQRLTFNPVSSQICRKVPWGVDSGQDGPLPEVDSSLGYIRVATFSKQTTEGVKAALHQLQSEGATRYVLDIRNNGGGLFPAGVDVARMLLDSGDIVLIADSQGVRDSYQANGTAVQPSAPLSVLVNRGTASASEVLAGAVRDNGRGKIVGETTFGKGLIQTIVELSDGSGVAVTVARYQTPDGTDINRKGIAPDIAISSDKMPPATGSGFCKYVGANGAAVVFDAAAASQMASRPVETLAASSTGTEEGRDTTLYENAFQQSSAAPEAVAGPEPAASPTGDPAPGDPPAAGSRASGDRGADAARQIAEATP